MFLAEDVVLRRRVAVKLLHPGLAEDQVFLRRFRAEAQQAAALNHPHIMRVYDWGESEDGPYLVLEHLGGGSLRDLLDVGHRLSPSQALVVGLEAARGLDHAHRRGLVHRDVKPANLLFDDEGRLAIADFGIARALAEAACTDPAGAVLGTARYVSPEQAQGSALDGKADVYALALVLVETVTGQVPFVADTAAATLMARVGATVEVPAELGPLAPIVARAATPSADQRLDARQLARALDRAAEALPAPAPLPLAPPEPRFIGMETDPGDLTALVAATGSVTRPVVHDDQAEAEDQAPTEDEAAADGGPDDEAVLAEPPRRRRVRPPWVVAVVLAALLLGGGAYGLARWRVPTHPVPALQGKPLEEAKAIASQSGLKVEVGAQRFEEAVAQGIVVDQDPALGELREGSTIKVVLSRGPPPRPVPDLTGTDRDTAEQRLRDSGFVAKVGRQFSEDQAAGAVLDWQPRGEQPKGAEIVVTVSGGPAPRKVPDVAGRTYEEAARALAAVRLKATRAEAFSDTVPAGRVIGTRPSSGSEAARDSAVAVVVSKGPDVVVVPNVVGRSVPQAQAALGQTGLAVVNVFGPLARPVFAMDPAPGATVRRGAGVSLYTR